jgi:hypothetical protein
LITSNKLQLPIATTSVLGGVKVDGSTITINSSTGVISGANTYVLPTATTSVLGGVKQGNNTSINENGIISVDLSSYNGNAIINGNLTASNLTVLGSSTTLDTNVYITERLEIFNDSLNNAVIIKQKANGYNIMNVSNLTNEVFSIGYNGNITFKESINNITATQFNQIANIATNDTNVSNYVVATSNALVLDYKRLDGNVSNYVRETCNFLYNNYSNLAVNISVLSEATGGGSSGVSFFKNITNTTKKSIYYGAPIKIGGDKTIDVDNNYVMDIVGNIRVAGIITTGWVGDNGSPSDGGGIISFGSNVINSEILGEASNYVRVASNVNVADYKRLDGNVSNYVGAVDTRLSSLISTNDGNVSNYVRVASNVNVADYKRLDGNVSNYIGAVDTRLSSLISTNDTNVSNYVRVASNVNVIDYKRLDGNVSNYIGAVDTRLSSLISTNDTNVSNYVRVASNVNVIDYKRLDANVSNYVRATSNFLYNNYSNLVANVAVSGGGLTYWKNITNTNTNSIYYGAPVKIGGDKTIDVANNYIMDIVGNIRVSGTITTGWSGDGGGSSDGGTSGSSGGGSGDSYWNAINLTRHIYYTSNVKIGGTSNVSPTNKLEVDGNISATGQIISGFSDNRLKTITSNINNPMDIISNLNGFYYIPNDIAISNCSAKNKEDIGLSAQDVNKILPHIVNLAPFDSFVDNSNNLISKSGCNYLTVNYEKLAPVFIEAIKTLNEKIIYLTNEIEKLKAKG